MKNSRGHSIRVSRFGKGESYHGSMGFTLLEVLVSMAILAICLTVIMELFSGGLKSGQLSKEYIQAVFLAREKMEDVLVAKELSEGITGGESGGAFSWEVDIRKVEKTEEDVLSKMPFETFEIFVRVLWGKGGKERNFVLHTLQTAKEKVAQENVS